MHSGLIGKRQKNWWRLDRYGDVAVQLVEGDQALMKDANDYYAEVEALCEKGIACREAKKSAMMKSPATSNEELLGFFPAASGDLSETPECEIAMETCDPTFLTWFENLAKPLIGKEDPLFFKFFKRVEKDTKKQLADLDKKPIQFSTLETALTDILKMMSADVYDVAAEIQKVIDTNDKDTEFIYVFGKMREEGADSPDAEVREDTTEEKASKVRELREKIDALKTKTKKTLAGAPMSQTWEQKFPDTMDQTKWKLLSTLQDLIERMRFRVGWQGAGTPDELRWLEARQADWVHERKYSLTMPRAFFFELMRFSQAASFGMTAGLSSYKRGYEALTKDAYVRLISPAYGYAMGGLSPQGRGEMQKAADEAPPGSMLGTGYIPDFLKFVFAQIPGTKESGPTFTLGAGKCWPL